MPYWTNTHTRSKWLEQFSKKAVSFFYYFSLFVNIRWMFAYNSLIQSVSAVLIYTYSTTGNGGMSVIFMQLVPKLDTVGKWSVILVNSIVGPHTDNKSKIYFYYYLNWNYINTLAVNARCVRAHTGKKLVRFNFHNKWLLREKLVFGAADTTSNSLESRCAKQRTKAAHSRYQAPQKKI